jgi:FAD dependent oxidoreductase TIGR03364
VERNTQAVGASIRNFGHACITAQTGLARNFAEISRSDWLTFGSAADAWVQEAGTLVVARTDAEEAVLSEFAADRSDEEVQLLSSQETASTLGRSSSGIRSGALMPRDLRIDPLDAIPRLARYLATQGVEFFFDTNVGTVETGQVRTSRGKLTAPHIVLAVGHDVDRFFPTVAGKFVLERCRLRMLEIDPPRGIHLKPAVFTGSSLLRYDAFRQLESIEAVQTSIEQANPELLEHDVNHMITQRPDGALVVGDTHHRDKLEVPFEAERSDQLLISETARLFDVEETSLSIRRRWRGIYASSSLTNFICETPLPNVRVAAVASGIGMTTSFGFAKHSLELLTQTTPHTPAESIVG